MTKKKVLVVDDSIVMRKMIGTVLMKGDYEVVGEATDGNEAFEKYKNLNPDIVTMDIVMPREHGIDAMKKIIDFDADARIIIVSGLHQKQLLMQALEAGVKDYVIKPFADQDLLDAVRKSAR